MHKALTFVNSGKMIGRQPYSNFGEIDTPTQTHDLS